MTEVVSDQHKAYVGMLVYPGLICMQTAMGFASPPLVSMRIIGMITIISVATQVANVCCDGSVATGF